MASQLRFLLPEEASERLEALLAQTYCPQHQTTLVEGRCWHCDEDEAFAKRAAQPEWLRRAVERRLPAKVSAR